ncbi:MAG: glycosyltransferase family 2 protein [Alkalinema sp. RL_2_19]|nr:glycosyltransferase family 2 protein [Alkalinema sp. RL_2_19]
MAQTTLQINLAPSDWLHAGDILPHQLRQFVGQVDEVLLTLDLHRSVGRFSEGWEERRPKLEALIEQCCQEFENVRSVIVDYSPEAMQQVSQTFFGDARMPAKDFRGGPFYAYFYGLYAATYDYVFHIDSDLMFGGGSQTWIMEAIAFLQHYPNVLVCGPLPGALPAMANCCLSGRIGFPIGL